MGFVEGLFVFFNYIYVMHDIITYLEALMCEYLQAK